MEEQKQEMRVHEAAEYIGVHPDTVRRLLRMGKLEGRQNKITRAWYIQRDSVEKYKRQLKGEE
jgi:excisionase family DNA binding protein